MTPTQSKTSDKSTSEKAAEDQAKDVQNQKDGPDEVGGVGADQTPGEARVIGVEDTLGDDLFSEAESEQFVTLNEDVIEAFYYPNTKRPAFRVLYTKGQRVQRSAIEAYNAETEAAKNRDKLEGEELVVATIDSTTLASGTSPGIGALKDKAGSGKK